MTTLAQLIDELDTDSVEATVYRVFDVIGVDHANWKVDSTPRVMTFAFSALLAYSTSVTANIARSVSLDLSSGGWLTLVARHVFATERITEQFAQGPVTLNNNSPTTYTIAEGDLIVGRQAGVEYRCAAVTVPGKVGSTAGTALAACVATTIGAVGNASPGTITTMVTPYPGVTCSNALPLTSGLDEESDSALRVRARAAQQLLSSDGPRGAYRYVCTSTKRADGTPIGVSRFRSIADSLGHVTCYVYGASGALLGSDVDLLEAAVQQQVEPFCVEASVDNAVEVVVPIEYTCSCYSAANLTAPQLEALIAARIGERLARLPIGGDNGVLAASSLLAAVYEADARVYSAILQLPAANITLTPSQVAVAGAITPHISITNSPGVGL